MNAAFVRNVRNIFSVAWLSIGLPGCGCDTIGCVDGSAVAFATAPLVFWKVELSVNGVL